MDLKKVEKEIRGNWFKNHVIKSIEGKEGFQRISWGESNTRIYQVDYVLTKNMVFISGDLGSAVYRLSCEATLDNIKSFDLSHFTGKLVAHEKRRKADCGQRLNPSFIAYWLGLKMVIEQLDEQRGAV